MTINKKDSNNASNLTRLVAIILGLPWMEILTEAWKYGRKLLRGLTSEGVYEVLEWENTLELHDKKGEKATFKKREKVRFLQDNILAYEDQAWGDGEILVNYRCTPGVEADHYRLGHKTFILISLRKVMNKGDVEEFNIQREIRKGFLRKTEQWETQIGHRVKKLRVNVIFPKTRHPLGVSVIERNRQRFHLLEEGKKRRLPDGRWQVTWEKENPKLFENYILNWDW